MKKVKLICSIALLALLLLWFAGCSVLNPKPKPTISFDYSFNANGEVDFFTTATNANSYTWNFGDGVTSTQKEPTHIYTSNDDFTVSVKATGDGGSTSSTQTVTVTNVVGQVMFWSNFDTTHGVIYVTLGGVNEGSIGSYYANSTPDCGANGCVTVSAAPGTYNFEAATGDNYFTWSGQVTITGGDCFKEELIN